MAERADEYQNKSFLLQTNERIHERIHEQTNEATYGGSTLPKNIRYLSDTTSEKIPPHWNFVDICTTWDESLS